MSLPHRIPAVARVTRTVGEHITPVPRTAWQRERIEAPIVEEPDRFGWTTGWIAGALVLGFICALLYIARGGA